MEARAKVDAEATAVRTQAEAVAEEVARTSPRDRDAVGFEVLDEVAGEREHRAGDRVLPQPRVPTLEAARHQIGQRQRLGHAVATDGACYRPNFGRGEEGTEHMI